MTRLLITDGCLLSDQLLQHQNCWAIQPQETHTTLLLHLMICNSKVSQTRDLKLSQKDSKADQQTGYLCLAATGNACLKMRCILMDMLQLLANGALQLVDDGRGN